ncbi:MAG: type II toxin-antitoxin system PemK/MazF family toxin [Candidatus Kapabacteria bacterium]|nr:type II toxin-antitoxin system PemK/MazF family toxin [Candidatus Kapabacteria bacterium]
MKQKDIFLANLNPSKGSEQQGIRPVVIISGNAMNDNLEVCIACPLSSVIKGYAGCVYLKKDDQNNLNNDSEVICFQIRIISNDRLISRMGEISDFQLNEIKKKLFEVLTF